MVDVAGSLRHTACFVMNLERKIVYGVSPPLFVDADEESSASCRGLEWDYVDGDKAS